MGIFEMDSSLTGAFPVLPTIFDDAGRMDEAGFRATIEFALGSGVDGVVFPGLASEYDQLTIAERTQLIEIVGATCKGRAHFIVGASSDNPADSVGLAKAGASHGASAAMVLTPKVFDGDIDRIAEFFSDLGERAAIPIMLQNAPRPMGLGLTPDEVAAIVAHAPGIYFIKEETQPCGQQISAHLAQASAGIEGIFGGAGGRYILDELGRGAVGTMPAVELADMHAMLISAHRTGNEEAMRLLYEQMLPILTMQAVFRWHLTKTVLKMRGIIASAYVRAAGPRLDALDEAELARMLARLEHALHVAPVRTAAMEMT
jgi:4-hydroxy-tetrahydrodipicolinate synthase